MRGLQRAPDSRDHHQGKRHHTSKYPDLLNGLRFYHLSAIFLDLAQFPRGNETLVDSGLIEFQ